MKETEAAAAADTAARPPEASRKLRSAEAAALIGVSAETVRNWERRGLLTATRTLGGHRRFEESYIRGIAQAGGRGEGR